MAQSNEVNIGMCSHLQMSLHVHRLKISRDDDWNFYMAQSLRQVRTQKYFIFLPAVRFIVYSRWFQEAPGILQYTFNIKIYRMKLLAFLTNHNFVA